MSGQILCLSYAFRSMTPQSPLMEFTFFSSAGRWRMALNVLYASGHIPEPASFAHAFVNIFLLETRTAVSFGKTSGAHYSIATMIRFCRRGNLIARRALREQSMSLI